MDSATLRHEYGNCNCMEHQASRRYREMVRELRKEVQELKKLVTTKEDMIARLQQDVVYWRD